MRNNCAVWTGVAAKNPTIYQSSREREPRLGIRLNRDREETASELGGVQLRTLLVRDKYERIAMIMGVERHDRRPKAIQRGQPGQDSNHCVNFVDVIIMKNHPVLREFSPRYLAIGQPTALAERRARFVRSDGIGLLNVVLLIDHVIVPGRATMVVCHGLEAWLVTAGLRGRRAGPLMMKIPFSWSKLTGIAENSCGTGVNTRVFANVQ